MLARLDALAHEPSAPRSAVAALRELHGERRAKFLADLDPELTGSEADLATLRLDLIGVERASIGEAYENNLITDESRRRLERAYDLEEASVRHALGEAAAD